MDRAIKTPDHIPVMVDEVLEYLKPEDRGIYFDGTVGMGGHAGVILEASAPGGMVIGVDLDPDAVEGAKTRLASYGERVKIREGNYKEVVKILKDEGIMAVDGIVLDLGIGSHQLSSDDRGFSIAHSGPLDMRYNPKNGISAKEVVNRFTEKELTQIIRDLGEERRARTISRGIIRARGKKTIEDSGELAFLVKKALGYKTKSRIHPATRTFMALRLYVNNELGNLADFIPEAIKIIKPGGKMIIISFHSLEDRVVKHAFKGLSIPTEGEEAPLKILTKKPITPDIGEVRRNPRARSAKLRAARRANYGC